MSIIVNMTLYGYEYDGVYDIVYVNMALYDCVHEYDTV
mgnify:CR=1 FL=1